MATTAEGGPVISGAKVRMAAHPIFLAERGGHGEPTVTLRRNGDLVSEIHIRCACGELIILDCDYDAANAPSS